MTRFVGLDVSQKLTAICVVDETGRRLWRGQCGTDPGQIKQNGEGTCGREVPKIGVETGPMTPCLVHELRGHVGSTSPAWTPGTPAPRSRCR